MRWYDYIEGGAIIVFAIWAFVGWIKADARWHGEKRKAWLYEGKTPETIEREKAFKQKDKK